MPNLGERQSNIAAGAITPAKAPPLPPPPRITVANRVFYEIRNTGVYRDLSAGDVIVDKTVIAEVIQLGAPWY